MCFSCSRVVCVLQLEIGVWIDKFVLCCCGFLSFGRASLFVLLQVHFLSQIYQSFQFSI
jgi:hypothetical protein